MGLETESNTSSQTNKMAVVQELPSRTSVTDNGRKAGDAIVPIQQCGAAQKEDETPHVSDRCEDGSLKSYFVSDASKQSKTCVDTFQLSRESSGTQTTSVGGHMQRPSLA